MSYTKNYDDRLKLFWAIEENLADIIWDMVYNTYNKNILYGTTMFRLTTMTVKYLYLLITATWYVIYIIQWPTLGPCTLVEM